MRPAPALSPEGTRELLDEMNRPPADTAERRRMWHLVDEMRPHVEQIMRPETPVRKG
jgi:hypothetical protein